ncbi:hypothetical protein ACLKA7_009173 [Drosophila subpalustris]
MAMECRNRASFNPSCISNLSRAKDFALTMSSLHTPRTKPTTSWLATVAAGIASLEQRQARLNCNKELFCNRQLLATVATAATVACIMQQAAEKAAACLATF